jgi:hypothetical protein
LHLIAYTPPANTNQSEILWLNHRRSVPRYQTTKRKDFRTSPSFWPITDGTKVKLWNNACKNEEFQTVAIERSYKDGDEWKTQKISLNADDLLSVARGLEKGHDAIVEKQISKQQLPGPLRIHGRSLREGLLGDWRPFTLLKE